MTENELFRVELQGRDEHATARINDVVNDNDGKTYASFEIEGNSIEAKRVANTFLDMNLGPSVPLSQLSPSVRRSFSVGSNNWKSSWNPKGPKTPWKNSSSN